MTHALSKPEKPKNAMETIVDDNYHVHIKKMDYIGNGFLQSDESMKINKLYVV